MQEGECQHNMCPLTLHHIVCVVVLRDDGWIYHVGDEHDAKLLWHKFLHLQDKAGAVLLHTVHDVRLEVVLGNHPGISSKGQEFTARVKEDINAHR